MRGLRSPRSGGRNSISKRLRSGGSPQKKRTPKKAVGKPVRSPRTPPKVSAFPYTVLPRPGAVCIPLHGHPRSPTIPPGEYPRPAIFGENSYSQPQGFPRKETCPLICVGALILRIRLISSHPRPRWGMLGERYAYGS
ncbi:hypothetical protein Y032_0007g3259 [Ancylostoma ceylanicum]|uniref:Uncharacterized protein n=1 Tax=Ancylostoma ceylanicum TaxID=53326 RepID=A0A016VMH6_9BILA|nr:hypothetical protein Y032_0007g3259 [Ancylostoma ceylanicum]